MLKNGEDTRYYSKIILNHVTEAKANFCHADSESAYCTDDSDNTIKAILPEHLSSICSEGVYESDEDSFSDYTDVSAQSVDNSNAISNFDLLQHTTEHSLSKDVGCKIFDINELGSVRNFIGLMVDSKVETRSFLVTNLHSVEAKYHLWRKELPLVEPFYAVKCLPDPVILKLLASLGCNFDCATMGELDLVLNGLDEYSLSISGRNPSTSIVYANPAKMSHMIDFAIRNRVRMTVFDGEDELYKIASLRGGQKLQLLLRLTTDDKDSVCKFSRKFGCPVQDAAKLLRVAKELKLNVAGVSFHVGSGCGDPIAYVTALQHARIVFDEAESLGMKPLHIIDIGGGFPGDDSGYGGPGMPTFSDLTAAIRTGIDTFANGFNRPLDEIRFIAEPGRYFVSASTVIATKVYARKGGYNNYQALYIDDGVYGSFNNVVYDHAHPVPLKLSDVVTRSFLNDGSLKGDPLTEECACENAGEIPTAVFGPTCDGLDQMCSMDSTTLLRCEVGDWLIWENQGAYTHTASFTFNGFTHVPKRTYCYFH